MYSSRRNEPTQAGPVEVLDPVHDPALAAHHAAPADEEHLERRLQVVLVHPDHVEVLGLREHHLLALDGLARGGELVAELRRPLVLLTAGGLLHLAFEPVQTGA